MIAEVMVRPSPRLPLRKSAAVSPTVVERILTTPEEQRDRTLFSTPGRCRAVSLLSCHRACVALPAPDLNGRLPVRLSSGPSAHDAVMTASLPASSNAAVTLPPGGRVAVVTGSFGAGHDAAAHTRSPGACARRDTRAGRRRRRGDDVRTRVASGVNAAERAWSPGPGGVLLWLLRGRSPVRHHVVAMLLAGRAGPSRGSGRTCGAHPPVAGQGVSACGASGCDRHPGRHLPPTPSVHALWVQPGTDVHLAWHAGAAVRGPRAGRCRGSHPPPGPDADVRRAWPRPRGGTPQARAAAGAAYALVVGGPRASGTCARPHTTSAPSAVSCRWWCGHAEDLRQRICGTPGWWRRLARRPARPHPGGLVRDLRTSRFHQPGGAGRPGAGDQLPRDPHGVANCEQLDAAGLVPGP